MSKPFLKNHCRIMFIYFCVVILSVILFIRPAFSIEKPGETPSPQAASPSAEPLKPSSPVNDKDGGKKNTPVPKEKEKADCRENTTDKFPPDSTITIQQAVELAMKYNLQLKAHAEKIVQAGSKYDQARSLLGIKSRLEARTQAQGPSRTLQDLVPYPIPTDLGIDPTYTVKWDFDASGRVVIEKILTTFGKVEHQKAAAFIKIEAEKQGLQALENDVTYLVKQSFYNILKAREGLKVAREFLTLAGEYEELAKKHYKAGIVSKFDVLRAGVSVAQAKKNIISAEKAVELSKSLLLIHIDQQRDIPFEIAAPLQVFLEDSVTLENLQNSALESRSEIKEICTYVRVAGKMLDAARSNNKPNLAASGEFGADVNPMGKGIVDNYEWNVGISFQIPLSDGGETAAKVKEAGSNLEQLKVNQESLRQHVRLQVKEAWLDYKEAFARVEVVRTELAKAKESYRLAKARYTEGVSIAVEMDDALVSYYNAQKNLVNALHDLNLAFASLEKSVGNKIEGVKYKEEIPDTNIKDDVKLEAKSNEK